MKEFEYGRREKHSWWKIWLEEVDVSRKACVCCYSL